MVHKREDSQRATELVLETLERLDFLDDIEARLRFPDEYRDDRYRMPPIAECLRVVMPWPRKWAPSIRDVDIRTIANALLNAHEVPEDAHYGFKFTLPRRESALVPPLEVEDEEDLKLRLFRTLGYYDVVAIVNTGMPLMGLACSGGIPRDPLFFEYIRIDKTFVTMPFCQHIIKLRQYECDWEFFRKLGKAIAAPPLKEEPYMYRALVVVAGLWEAVFKDISYPATVRLLEEVGLLPVGSEDPRAFAQRMRRAGLKKTKHARKQNCDI